MKYIEYLLLTTVGLSLAPLVVYAAPASGKFSDVMAYFINVIGKGVIPMLLTMAVMFFMWGVLQYVGAGGDEKKRSEGRGVMTNGVLAIFVMVSIWGFVNLLINSFFDPADVNIATNDVYQLPES